MEEKYIEIIGLRIEENRKIENKMLLIMMFSFMAFLLLREAKISEFSIGPFKINDLNLVWVSMPSIFAYCNYKYSVVYYELKFQLNIYEKLTQKIFNFKEDNYLNSLLVPFSFLEKIREVQFKFNNKYETIFLVSFLYLPVLLVLFIIQFCFVLYASYELFISKVNYVFIIVPILLFLSNLIYIFKMFFKFRKDKNAI